MGDSCIETHTALFEHMARPARGLEPKGAPARQHNGVHERRDMAGMKRFKLAGSCGRSPHVHAADRIGAAENDRTSGERLSVRGMAHQDSGDIG